MESHKRGAALRTHGLRCAPVCLGLPDPGPWRGRAEGRPQHQASSSASTSEAGGLRSCFAAPAREATWCAGTQDWRRRVRRSRGLLEVAGAGFQLLLGPCTSGVDVTFLFLVIDAGASRPRSTRGAPSSPPPPLRPRARPSHPPGPTHGTRARSRRFAPPTPRLHA